MKLDVKKKQVNARAFTLVEILITLGLIGVVAALTIPALIKNYQKAQTVTQLKNTYSILNNALEMAKSEHGTNVNTWYIPDSSVKDASTYFAQNYLLPYLKVIDTCGTSTAADCRHYVDRLLNKTSPTKSYYAISGSSNIYSFTLANNVMIGVYVRPSGTAVANTRPQLYFDINGRKPPNIMRKDGFLIELGGSTGGPDKNKFWPYAYAPTTNRNSYFGNIEPGGDANGCNIIYGSGSRCFALIFKDNWQIADDYPWD